MHTAEVAHALNFYKDALQYLIGHLAKEFLRVVRAVTHGKNAVLQRAHNSKMHCSRQTKL